MFSSCNTQHDAQCWVCSDDRSGGLKGFWGNATPTDPAGSTSINAEANKLMENNFSKADLSIEPREA